MLQQPYFIKIVYIHSALANDGTRKKSANAATTSASQFDIILTLHVHSALAKQKGMTRKK